MHRAAFALAGSVGTAGGLCPEILERKALREHIVNAAANGAEIVPVGQIYEACGWNDLLTTIAVIRHHQPQYGITSRPDAITFRLRSSFAFNSAMRRKISICVVASGWLVIVNGPSSVTVDAVSARCPNAWVEQYVRYVKNPSFCFSARITYSCYNEYEASAAANPCCLQTMAPELILQFLPNFRFPVKKRLFQPPAIFTSAAGQASCRCTQLPRS